MQLILLLLVLVPAPKVQTPAPSPLVGAWALDWGSIEQTTFLYADGTCWSPQYGGGLWSEDADGYIWFSERENANPYVMWFDRLEGTGTGWRVGDNGPCGAVEIRMRRGERLPWPRVFE